MKVYYDKNMDALYLQFSEENPDGVIEIKDEVNLDVSDNGKIFGIEILNASQKIDMETIFTYSLEESLIV